MMPGRCERCAQPDHNLRELRFSRTSYTVCEDCADELLDRWAGR